MGVVLVMNAGSTSVKLRLVDEDGGVTPVDSAEEAPGDLQAVGHRIVHGGERFRDPVVLDDATTDALGGLSALAPLHNGPALRIAAEARRRYPGVPHVAVFDTAFHATIPEEATTYALPRAWREAGIRRYGFHGLSVEWATERAAALLGAPPARLVVSHIGGGASATAVLEGRSVDTTMGFSPLEGLVMARVEREPLDPEGVGQQQVGVEAGRRRPALGEEGRAAAQHLAHREQLRGAGQLRARAMMNDVSGPSRNA